MSIYLVTYQTKREILDREHEVLRKLIHKATQSYGSLQIMNTAWLIDSDDSATEIRNAIKHSIRNASNYFEQLSDISVYVHKMARSNWATLNSSEIAAWLKNQRQEQDYRHASFI